MVLSFLALAKNHLKRFKHILWFCIQFFRGDFYRGRLPIPSWEMETT